MLRPFIVKKIKLIVRGMVNSLLLKTLCCKEFDLANTLVVVGSTRSGTTWLSEIVNGISDSVILFEPLSPTHVSEAKRVGFTYDTFLESSTVWPEGRQFMEKILSGRVLTSWTTSQIPIKETCSAKVLIVKFVRANMLLGWITANFPIRPPALIVRHPCATIASQMKKGWIPSLNLILGNSFFDSSRENLRKYCNTLSHPEEILALRWCMRYYVPMSLPDRPFVLVCFERLVRDGEEEVRRLFDRWDIDLPAESLARLKRPSKTVMRDSQIVKGYDPLQGWKKDLSSQQVQRILRVVSAFGLDFYSEDIEPDYERLYNEIPVCLN